MEYLFVASGSIILFILALIIGKENKARADYILFGILFTLLINFVSLFILNVSIPPFSIPKELIFEFSEASIFLYGPLLWLYSISLTRKKFKVNLNIILHLIPFIVSLFYFILGVLTSLKVDDNSRNFLMVLKLSSVLLYNIWSLQLLRQHEKNIENIFSNLDHKKLTWLKFFCWSIIVITAIAISSLLVDRLSSLNVPQYGGILTNVALCIFVYALGYFGFKQEFIFRSLAGKEVEKEKYLKSGLKAEKTDSAFLGVKEFIEKQKPFLDADLTLYGLAEQLELKPNHLSQIINSGSGSNFYDFINGYRVEEAKTKITSEESRQYTLLGVGMSCGFSSKSTFNRAFKKRTGLTPSEFKNSTQ